MCNLICESVYVRDLRSALCQISANDVVIPFLCISSPQKLRIPLILSTVLQMEIHVAISHVLVLFCCPAFSSKILPLCTYFTRVAASIAATDDVTYYVMHRLVYTDNFFLQFFASSTLKCDEKHVFVDSSTIY